MLVVVSVLAGFSSVEPIVTRSLMSDISQVCDAVPCRQLTTKDPRHDADSGSGGGVLAWCRSAVMQAALATALIARSAGRPGPYRPVLIMPLSR